MGKYIKGYNRTQVQLLPHTVDEYIDENNEVRVIDAFVDTLDLDKLGFSKSTPSYVGAPSYDPRDLLKIYIYSYPKSIRSSRKIAKEIKRNLELIWLVGGIKPDFRTISDFRKDNINPIKNVLKQFNKLCLDLNVFSRELSSLDGTKFKAVNSKDNNFTKDKLIDRVKRLNNKVDEYMTELENADSNNLATEDKIDITDKLNKAKQKAIEYNHYLEKIADNGENQISLTDKESRLMKCNNNMLVGFNAQMNVDTKSHIITSIDVSNRPNDNGNMFEMAEKTKDAFEVNQIEQLADGGYVDTEDIKKCLENKIVPILPDGEYTVTWEYKDNNISDEIKKGNTKEDVKMCLESGIIPDCYSYLNMEIEVKKIPVTTNKNAVLNESDENILIAKANEGFFVRNREKNVVYCPCNNILNFKRKKKTTDLFIGNSKCINCPNKCTKSTIKELEMRSNEDIAACQKFKTYVKKNTKITYQQKVFLKYIPDKNKYKLRKNTSEHPFGTLKRSHDATYLLLKGIDKVEGELVLSILGYNINRLIKIIGVKKLIEHLKSRDNTSTLSITTKKNIKSAKLHLFFYNIAFYLKAFFRHSAPPGNFLVNKGNIPF